MQKSAHTNSPAAPRNARHTEPLNDKGQKYEPFWNTTFGSDRRSQARLHKADQKR